MDSCRYLKHLDVFCKHPGNLETIRDSMRRDVPSIAIYLEQEHPAVLTHCDIISHMCRKYSGVVVIKDEKTCHYKI